MELFLNIAATILVVVLTFTAVVAIANRRRSDQE